MLKILRDKKISKKIWIVLSVVIISSFVFLGTGGINKSDKKPATAGTISGKKVPFEEYEDALLATKNQALIQFGDALPQMQQYINLKSQAWERLVLLAEAKRRKIKVSDQEVVELIASYPFFQKNGRFHKGIYSQLLQYYFRTPARTFEEQMRQNLILSKLYVSVTRDVSLEEKEIKEAYAKANEQIRVDYIAGLSADFEKDIKTSENEIEEYYAKNALEFKEPLTFNLEYLDLEATADNKSGIEEKIRTLYERLKKEKNLAKVAREANLGLKETGYFPQEGPIPGIGWSGEVLTLISKLKPKDFPQPINIDTHYYIIQLKERKEPHIPDFSEIKEKVKNKFVREKSRSIAQEKIGLAFKKVKDEYTLNPKGVDFNRIAREFGLKSDVTQLFKYGSYIEGIGSSDNFWLKSVSLKIGEVSDIIDMPSGFYIVKPKEKIQIDEKKFEQEKEDFSARLLIQKRQEVFVSFVEELKKKAQPY